MGAISNMILSACLSVHPGQARQACDNAVQAGLKQSGVEKHLDKTEKRIKRKAENQVDEFVGQEGKVIIGDSLLLIKTISDKSVKFKLPTFGLCDSATNEIGVDSYKVNMEWRF